MTVVGVRGKQSTLQHNARASIFCKNIWMLCQEHHVLFTPKFAQAVRTPNHILGRFFSKYDFQKDKVLLAALDSPEFAMVLQQSFLKFIGIPEEARKLKDEIRHTEIHALHRVMEIHGKEVFKERLQSLGRDDGFVSPVDKTYLMCLSSNHFNNVARCEEVQKSISKEHQAIRIIQTVKHGKITLDYKEADVDTGILIKHTSSLSEVPTTDPDAQESSAIMASLFDLLVEEARSIHEDLERDSVSAMIAIDDSVYGLEDVDPTMLALVNRAREYVEDGKIDRAVNILAKTPEYAGDNNRLCIVEAMELLFHIRGREIVMDVIKKYFGDVLTSAKPAFCCDYFRQLDLVSKVLAKIGEKATAKRLIIEAAVKVNEYSGSWADFATIVRFLSEIGEIDLAERYSKMIEHGETKDLAFAYISREKLKQ
ncbi:hypothetical protein AMJ44_04030 [candidate division WOR-1 bacterium DG_54_3]|uniref:Uncharacterized protein n=1 Tax=candidate division WOR-1 bacterium DG_54_3 TaxID=1703775 RepID=A0A0S7Y3L4_UNCSA|nr:MAG: hypothetical protein AMJ44_04030 [candidate division WOR-1 bacterium DG_54_3]